MHFKVDQYDELVIVFKSFVVVFLPCNLAPSSVDWDRATKAHQPAASYCPRIMVRSDIEDHNNLVTGVVLLVCLLLSDSSNLAK